MSAYVALVVLGTTMVMHAIHAGAVVLLLDLRHRAAYVATYLLVCGVLTAVRFVSDSPVRALAAVATPILLPLAFSRESREKTLLVSISLLACMALAEMASQAMWIGLMGSRLFADYESMVRDHLPCWLLLNLIFDLVFVGGVFALRIATVRLSGHRERLPYVFVAFPLAQVTLLWFTAMAFSGIAFDASVYVPAVLAAGICLVADVLLFVVVDRYRKTLIEEERARAARKRLDDAYARSRETIARIEETARFRHDVRNQLQTALALAERSDREGAQRHLAELRRRLG